MGISEKIKSIMTLKNVKSKDLAVHLGITQQSMVNKFVRGSFSAEDLIKIGNYLNVELAYNVDDNVKIVFDESDIRVSEEKKKI